MATSGSRLCSAAPAMGAPAAQAAASMTNSSAVALRASCGQVIARCWRSQAIDAQHHLEHPDRCARWASADRVLWRRPARRSIHEPVGWGQGACNRYFNRVVRTRNAQSWPNWSIDPRSHARHREKGCVGWGWRARRRKKDRLEWFASVRRSVSTHVGSVARTRSPSSPGRSFSRLSTHRRPGPPLANLRAALLLRMTRDAGKLPAT